MFSISKGGCNTRHPQSFFITKPNGSTDWVLLITKTPALYKHGGKTYNVAAETAIIFPPNYPYFYHNPNGEYMDDWLHFSIDSPDNTLPVPIEPCVFFHVDNTDFLTVYLRQILWENAYTAFPAKEQNVDHLMSILFNHLSTFFSEKDAHTYYNPYYQKLKQVRIAMQDNYYEPKPSEYYAAKIGISQSHFQHLYKELFGIPFQKDYIKMRIDYSKSLLETSEMSIEQISETCGYSSSVHFHRQFKEMTNMTPAKYRKLFFNDFKSLI